MTDAQATANRVLVVDDERALAGVIASYLAKAGFEVTQAYTGPDAVTTARDDDPDDDSDDDDDFDLSDWDDPEADALIDELPA